MRKKLLAFLLLAGGSLCAQVFIGVTIGPPPPPRVIRVRPMCPGPEYLWIEGYWYPDKHHYKWHDGYWTLPPYGGAYWVAPHHDGARFFEGYWEGGRGKLKHDHHWDRKHDRDFGHDHERGRGRH